MATPSASISSSLVALWRTIATRRHRHCQRDQFADLGIELADLRCAVGDRAVAAHNIGRCLADLLDGGNQLLPILLPIHHHGCRPPVQSRYATNPRVPVRRAATKSGTCITRWITRRTTKGS